MEAPRVCPKAEQTGLLDYSFPIGQELFITQILHFYKEVISNFRLYLQ